ncbi:MAG: alkaline phosphatase family protein [Deltaproteobacteria bacterium]|nr:alkaline phosphatase family protein [Deltaproteobacteria bacterium]
MNRKTISAMAEAVRRHYRKGMDDELLGPIVSVDDGKRPVGRIERGDSVIFYNIRGEREIELTRSLTENNFTEFPVKQLDLSFATMIQYQPELNAEVAFLPDGPVRNTLSHVLAGAGKAHLKITESEKAVHLGYFLNGKNGRLLDREERIVIPSRKDVSLFDEAPDMSIEAVAGAVFSALGRPDADIITVNFPNVDVVGHIENERAIVQAVETVDSHTGRLVEEALRRNVAVVITADHGTVEKWRYADGAIDTGHTDSPVPFILIDGKGEWRLRTTGELADAAPTILDMLGLPQPAEMTGRSLVEKRPDGTVKRLLMIILDGWGYSAVSEGNLIAAASTPVVDRLMALNPLSILDAAGEAVGLPKGTVGNSEVGHLHIGAGRRIDSDRVRIAKAIEDGSFFENEAFLHVIGKAKRNKRALHLLGIVSFFSSHGSVDHLMALLRLAKRAGAPRVFIHAMLGRRGERPESGALYIEEIEKVCRELDVGAVVSVIGRYWSLDREKNWDRIERTYRMLLYGEGEKIVVQKAQGTGNCQ